MLTDVLIHLADRSVRALLMAVVYGRRRGSPHTGESCCEWANIPLETASICKLLSFKWADISRSLSVSPVSRSQRPRPVPFGPIIFGCDSLPRLSIKQLMRETLNKVCMLRTDTACGEEGLEGGGRDGKTRPLCAKVRGGCWEHPDGFLPLLSFFFHPPAPPPCPA